MIKCPQCDQIVKTTHCIHCAIEVTAPNPEAFPPIVWQQIRDHLVRELMIDPQWMVEDDDEITWWPGHVPQKIFVSNRVEIEIDGIPQTLVRVTIESVLGRAKDRSNALDAVADYMSWYPFGSIVVLDDNRVVALASLALHGRNRSVLALLHHEALVQATFAQDISANLIDDGVVEANHLIHPSSGRRDEPDELLQNVYGNESFEPIGSGLVSVRELVRSFWRRSTLQTSGELGFENDEITFINFEDGFDCGVGWADDQFFSLKFGPALLVINYLATYNESFSAEEINSLNILIALSPYDLSHIGGITQQMQANVNTIKHIAVLPHYFLQTAEHALDRGTITAFNGILQAIASARYAHSLLHRDAENNSTTD